MGRESCTNETAKYSSSVVPPDLSVHFYHWGEEGKRRGLAATPCESLPSNFSAVVAACVVMLLLSRIILNRASVLFTYWRQLNYPAKQGSWRWKCIPVRLGFGSVTRCFKHTVGLQLRTKGQTTSWDNYYPRESFREGLCNHRRWFVCLFVTTITK